MTIKEISAFTGKNRTTIERWCAKCTSNESIINKVQNAHKGYPADFTIDEVEFIMQSGSMSKDAVGILMQSARAPIQNVQGGVDFIQMFKAMMNQQQQFMTAILSEIKGNNKQEQKQIEYVPEISPRRLFVNKVLEYAKIINKAEMKAYNEVYNHIGMTFGIRITARARNRNIKRIDVLDQDGYLEKSIIVIDRMIRKELV